ncbi:MULTISPECIES: hypothetical protein [Rikenellaceae]|uniref:hypothetical protein n=1 Tax=Rikenellaceae TaxID=171550 RepID=UPI002639F290|nr:MULTISPECIES: hypothetical protein [Rikenellaceae]
MKSYRIELSCSDENWWRYNVVMTAEGLDSAGNRCGYHAVEDRIAETGERPAERPADYPADRITRLECGPCERLQLYLYILPHCLPAAVETEHTPPFPARLRLFCDGKPHLERTIDVNPWGGYAGFFEWE